MHSVSMLNSCRSQYFSPLDDLAFDMYQDPDVAQVIRKLEKKKRDAVSSKYSAGIFVLRKVSKSTNSVFCYEVENKCWSSLLLC